MEERAQFSRSESGGGGGRTVIETLIINFGIATPSSRSQRERHRGVGIWGPQGGGIGIYSLIE